MLPSLRHVATLVWVVLCCASTPTLLAHVGPHPSVHDTVAGILDRLRKSKPPTELRNLTLAELEAFLTPQERQILGTEHLSFRVNTPVRLSLFRDKRHGSDPFWLRDRAFQRTDLSLTIAGIEFDVWQKDFPAGPVGLGVNSLRGGNEHYFITLAPQAPAAALEVSDLYPGQLRTGRLAIGEKPYVDREESFTNVPPALAGQLLIRTERARRDAARMLSLFTLTRHPATRRPDPVLLTWSDDPRTTQTIQWRTSAGVRKGAVAWQKKADYHQARPRRLRETRAESVSIVISNVVNDPAIQWHTVTLRNLEPATTYVYSVGHGDAAGWSELAEFTTAPDATRPFSFIYMGDAQNGLDRWGTLVQRAFRERPDAAFYIMAGDLVDRGAERDDWDSLFFNARDIYNRRPVVPAIGNHECQGGHPSLYLKFFGLPRNGPPALEAERAYSFDYSNARFIILDSNLAPDTQTSWLEQQLASSRAKWKFVVYHHPAYSSAPKRDNEALRKAWGPLFDKYHVDLALQGHDHAYLRTYPMKNGQRVASPAEGTVYIVSVSGTKLYTQDPRDYTEFGMTNVATYQVLDIQVSNDRLVYRAYDVDGRLRDELVIVK